MLTRIRCPVRLLKSGYWHPPKGLSCEHNYGYFQLLITPSSLLFSYGFLAWSLNLYSCLETTGSLPGPFLQIVGYRLIFMYLYGLRVICSYRQSPISTGEHAGDNG